MALKSVKDRSGKAENQTVSVYESYPVASWLGAKTLDQKKLTGTFRRRKALEKIEVTKSPPRTLSKIARGKIKSSEAIWAAVLDENTLVEVQTIFRRNYLCLFDLKSRLFHYEETAVAFAAIYGPDSGDIARWQERVISVVAQKLLGGRKKR